MLLLVCGGCAALRNAQTGRHGAENACGGPYVVLFGQANRNAIFLIRSREKAGFSIDATWSAKMGELPTVCSTAAGMYGCRRSIYMAN